MFDNNDICLPDYQKLRKTPYFSYGDIRSKINFGNLPAMKG